jgi:hypothetical protein
MLSLIELVENVKTISVFLSSGVDSVCVNIDALAILFKSSKIEMLSSETSDLHVSWFICQQFFSHSTGSFSHLSFMEWFRLIKLLSILSSLLISVNILFGGPACAIP